MPVFSNNKYKQVLVNVINVKDIAYISASIYLLIHSLPFILSRVAGGARVYPSYHRVTLNRLPVCCRASNRLASNTERTYKLHIEMPWADCGLGIFWL